MNQVKPLVCQYRDLFNKNEHIVHFLALVVGPIIKQGFLLLLISPSTEHQPFVIARGKDKTNYLSNQT